MLCFNSYLIIQGQICYLLFILKYKTTPQSLNTSALSFHSNGIKFTDTSIQVLYTCASTQYVGKELLQQLNLFLNAVRQQIVQYIPVFSSPQICAVNAVEHGWHKTSL